MTFGKYEKHDLLVAGAAVLWGTAGVVGRTLYAGMGAHPITVAFARLLFSVPVLWMFAFYRGGHGFLPFTRSNWRAVLISAIAVAAYQMLYFNAVARAGVMAATVLALCSAPVFAGLLARVVLGELLPWKWWLALGLSVGGTILIVASERPTVNASIAAPQFGPAADLSGYLMALGAGLCYATYTVAGKEVIRENNPLGAMSTIFGLATLLLAPLVFGRSFGWMAVPGALPLVLYVGGIATGVAYALFSTGLRVVPVRVATLYTLLEPLTASLLAVLFLSEGLSPQKILGGVILLAGLLILEIL